MTREEYIKDLVSQNITGREIVELASQFENEEEEEVKTEVVANQTGAAVTTTNQEASESSDGQSLSDEEKAVAAAANAAELKATEDTINSLYNKYNEDAQDSFFNTESNRLDQQKAKNLSIEEKQKWLEANIIDKKEGMETRQFIKNSPDILYKNPLQKYNPAYYLTRWLETASGLDEEASRLKKMKADKELSNYMVDKKNQDWVDAQKAIADDPNLSIEEIAAKSKELKMPSPVTEVEEKVEITKTSDDFIAAAVSIATMSEEKIQDSPIFQDINGNYNPEKRKAYDNYMTLTDEISDKTSKRNGMINQRTGMVYPRFKDEYFSINKRINEADKERKKIVEPFDEETRSGKKGVEKNKGFTGDYYTEKRMKSIVDPAEVDKADTYLPQNFGLIESDEDLQVAMKDAYAEYVKADPIISSMWTNLQKIAEPRIKAFSDELLKTADLKTPEGVAAANAKVQEYAKSITSDVLIQYPEYQKRVTDLGTVMDRAMAAKSTAYDRQQKVFLRNTDALRGSANDMIPLNDTIANLAEGIWAGTTDLANSARKAWASLEAKGVRNVQRQIKAIDDRVESGEITKEEGERLKNQSSKTDADGKRRGAGATFSTKSLLDELASDMGDVEQIYDRIKEVEEYRSLFTQANFEDGISFQDAVLTTAQALPQIGIAMVGAGSGYAILAGLGTAAMFTQMYGDNYWNAYQEGIKKEARVKGIDLDAMSPENRRAFEINSLNEGKHANMATSAAFSVVMTGMEQLGASKVLEKTERALGLGKGGMVSFYKGSWKQSGDALLKSALAKGEAGLTEFATEFAQEVAGQFSTGLQAGNTADEYLDWGASLESGKAGGIVGVMIPFAGSVYTQSTVEIRNISRQVAIKFAPNSQYGKMALEQKAYFDNAQQVLDKKLKNDQITKEKHQEESSMLSDTRNSALKIDPNADQNLRTRQLDLMVKKNQLVRKIQKIGDSDLTIEEEAELEQVKNDLRAVVAEQKLYNTSGNVRKALEVAAKKAGKDLTFQDFKSIEEMDAFAEEMKLKGYEKQGSKDPSGDQHGVTLYDPATGKEIILVNNEVALGKDGFTANTNVAAHEFLHSILRKTIQNNPEVALELSTELKTYLDKLDPTFADPNSEYAKNFNLYKEGNIRAEEMLTLFSDALANGDIVLNEGAITKINDFFRRLFQKLGIKQVNLNDGKDVVKFIKDFNKTIEKGESLNQAQQRVLEEGAKGELIDRAARRGIASKPGEKKERYKDSQIPTSQQKFTVQDDGGSTTIVKVTTNLDGSRKITQELEDGTAVPGETISKDNTLTNENYVTNAYGNIKQTEEVDIKTVRNPKLDERMSDRQREAAKKSKKRKQETVLESINELVPKDITTKKEYDNFIRSREGQKLFNSVIQEGGAINNYVRSRTTTKAESDKAIESLTDRILNFNPEAKRSDGKPVGIKGFGEAIFANTRFAKLDAKKALFKEGEKAKQEKSIDSGTLQIANESSTSTKDDNKLAKPPSETTGLDKVTESEITKAVNESFDKGIGFAETRNVPKNVAQIYVDMLGLTNANRLTDKTQNFTKGDERGLTKAKQFLLKNAQADFARMVELKNDLGKGTFLPKNIKDALFTDGELTATLKDYMNLIKQKPVKPIYRDSVGQTIRGLLNLHIRNRILETTTSQAKRLQSGAKFSRKRKVTPQIEKDLRKMSQLVDKGQIAKALNFVSDPINEGNRAKLQEAMLKAVQDYGLDMAVIKAGMMGSGGRATFYGKITNGKFVANANGAKYFKTTDGKYIKDGTAASKMNAADNWVARPGRLYYGVEDSAYKTLEKASKESSKKAKRNLIPGKKGKKVKLTPEQIRKQQPQNKINMDTLDHVVNQLADAVAPVSKEDAERLGRPMSGMSMDIAGAIIIQSYQATTGLVKIAAPFRYVSNKMEYSTDGKLTDRTGEKFREEHNPPASVVGASILYAIKNNAAVPVMAAIKKNYYQTQLSKKDDTKLDVAKLAGVLPEGKSILDNPVTRLTDAGISLSSITNPLTGQTLAQENNVEVPSNLESDPNVIAIQNSLVSEQQRIENPITAKQAQDRMNVFTESLAKPTQQASKKRVKDFSPKLSNDQTVDKQIEVLGNYDKASAKARSLSTPEKGISVFDFDDTLAKTKEKIIVNKLDGTTELISAAEFAKSAVKLEGDGATFDFTNFENVGKGTQKGPLADLALKRQEKFGSKDIFVLTARPQVAAQGIKVFLDGIGLSLPLANITGLENGSPQAKADWVVEKAADGYNDFYFADDAIKNVKAVKEVLNQIDVKSDVQQAKFSKKRMFEKITNEIIESSTGIKTYKEYSPARAKTLGAKKGRFSFFTTPSAEDFLGLLYKMLGKGKKGDAQLQFFQDNLIDPYNRAEQAVTRAKIAAANDFKALKNSLKTLPKSLAKKTGIGGFTFSQAARVAAWTRQGMEVPGLSKQDLKQLNDFVDNNPELNSFVDELIKIQKGKPYPAPGQNWLAGNITSDIINEINKVNRAKYMQEFNENVDLIFTDKVMNKLEAAYGSNYVEALRDQLRRMKAGSNRPIGNSRIVDQILNWLNNSVGAIMFLNTRSAVLQTISAINFINFGNNNLFAAGRALLNQKQYWKDFMTLMNSPYLVERRDGLKINVSESEIADAVSESSNKPKAFLNLLLSKGFILTRIADSFAIASGGATFYRNQVKAYMKSGMDQKAAEKQAFDDFYAVAETSQQSSNPSKISQQQASGAGRVILAFANTPMQYARIIKRATQDLIAGRGDWKTNISKIVYYSTIQNLIFNALSNALFALAFGEEDEEKEDKTGRIANGMADSLLRGLGIQGALVAAVKDALITIYEQANKEKGAPEFRKAINDLFGFSPPLDAKIRKLNSGLNTLSWEREKMAQEGYNLNNPAYLAYAQILAGLTNIPLDRAIQKINNLRAATSDSSAKWQKVALLMGWSTWDLGLPYYGVEDKVEMTPQMILKQKVDVMKKETNTKEQKETLLKLGLTKQQIKALKYEDARVKKIIELQNK